MPYVTYLRDPDQHTNAYHTHAGYGETREESQANANYYANQLPWVVTVPASRAPKWARATAWTTRRHELTARESVGPRLTAEEEAELETEMAYERYGF